MPSLKKHLEQQLQQRQQANLYRHRASHLEPQAVIRHIQGRSFISFCSNDYLGLANHPALVKTCQSGLEDYGLGAGAAHLLHGHSQAHEQLETALADFTGRERALLFSTGYMANLGIISALLDRQDAVILDKLDHASLIDGAILSRAQIYRYPHGNLEILERQLKTAAERSRFCLLVTDGVFSMDGTLAPLPEMVALAAKYQAWLMVDDAHGFGVLGDSGGGCLEHFALDTEQVPILMATLGKAAGVFGAFVAGSEVLIESLIQSARSYIYTTALPPALALATRQSLQLIQDETWRRQHLQQHIQHFRAGAKKLGLPLVDSLTPIQPVILGSSEQALAASKLLYEAGLLISAIRPPTVPKNSARLRITFSASHEAQQIDYLLSQLARL
ncbi:8-amino-7-oxononanoate synthase [Candidatus Venteria ishoeyi]|uniref:8-amino-7-oxononanoate synthase n=1 Tax=Candidatus Venteria ishoeyi TaxID=1899563 RepID=A0A1H6FCB4_9GAMM|nr:8-amino-7-oxononanoate synthase [Candidatus Venteria ishoeyi]SEH07718.1 8-amino-7-oxononanoate synthase [Candidatus Venteria ishoeyi]